MLRVTLSANAGVTIDFEGHRIWVDTLHQRKVVGFSSVTEPILQQLWEHEAFREPNLICYTHRHPDHYSRELTLEAQKHWPQATVIAPDIRESGWKSVAGERWEYFVDDDDYTLDITYIRLPHEGAEFADTIHYGILLTCDGKSVLIPGDCRLCDPALAEVVKDANIFAVLLDFPWISLPKPRQFVLEHFPGAKILVYHLPFAQDDVNHYRDAAIKAASRMGDQVNLLLEPFQSVEF
jgi:L-ascorbate metabolism protein UlaG (beta-lactamase superfamily)